MAVTTFIANYASECPSCSTSIEIGEEVAYTAGRSGDVVHVSCAGKLGNDNPEVCPICWQTRSNNGACGCDLK